MALLNKMVVNVFIILIKGMLALFVLRLYNTINFVIVIYCEIKMCKNI